MITMGCSFSFIYYSARQAAISAMWVGMQSTKFCTLWMLYAGHRDHVTRFYCLGYLAIWRLSCSPRSRFPVPFGPSSVSHRIRHAPLVAEDFSGCWGGVPSSVPSALAGFHLSLPALGGLGLVGFRAWSYLWVRIICRSLFSTIFFRWHFPSPPRRSSWDDGVFTVPCRCCDRGVVRCCGVTGFVVGLRRIE
jgi:hypothetical protein